MKPLPLQALQPYISEEIMKLHHLRHHQTYVNGLNVAEEAYSKTDSTTEKIFLQSALKFNGGGLNTLSPLLSIAANTFS
jgi:Fe-Mn family superoxide dismutase